ncbi:hypothetical protein DITRI_Ditri07aG0123500 [Diplodiscus trichospermus]
MVNTEETSLHVAIVPTPGMGHLIPLVEFAKISLSLVRSLFALKTSLKVLVKSTRLVALVVDLFGIEEIDVFKEFGLKPYIFFPTTAMVLQLLFHLPKLDQMFSYPVQNKKDVGYQGVLELCRRCPLVAGIMVNSFIDLEEDAFKALIESECGLPLVYPIGPLIQTGSFIGADGSNCLRWLDGQPNGSAMYVCFRSSGTLSYEQLIELAFGLEMSGQRFMWVVKSPSKKARNANYFCVESVQDPLQFLPDGFLERTKRVGLMVTSWAP